MLSSEICAMFQAIPYVMMMKIYDRRKYRTDIWYEVTKLETYIQKEDD